VHRNLHDRGYVIGSGNSELRPGVKSIPPHHEKEDPERGQRHAVTGNGFALTSDKSTEPGTQHDRRRDGREAAHAVNDHGSGEVDVTETIEESSAPLPHALDGIEKAGDDERGDEVSEEVHPSR